LIFASEDQISDPKEKKKFMKEKMAGFQKKSQDSQKIFSTLKQMPLGNFISSKLELKK